MRSSFPGESGRGPRLAAYVSQNKMSTVVGVDFSDSILFPLYPNHGEIRFYTGPFESTGCEVIFRVK